MVELQNDTDHWVDFLVIPKYHILTLLLSKISLAGLPANYTTWSEPCPVHTHGNQPLVSLSNFTSQYSSVLRSALSWIRHLHLWLRLTHMPGAPTLHPALSSYIFHDAFPAPAACRDFSFHLHLSSIQQVLAECGTWEEAAWVPGSWNSGEGMLWGELSTLAYWEGCCPIRKSAPWGMALPFVVHFLMPGKEAPKKYFPLTRSVNKTVVTSFHNSLTFQLQLV